MALIHRMKILLSVLQELGGQMPDARMQRLLFLYCAEYVKRDEYYEFIPLEGFPYSVQAEDDRQHLIRRKTLEKSGDWTLRPTDKRYATGLDFFEKIAVHDVKNNWQQKSDEELARHITERYPQFEKLQAATDEMAFYTIGYEGVTPEAYINALLDKEVRMLVDVRRNAYSQKYGFSKAELSAILQRVGIEYMHLPALGIESEKRQALNTGQDYEALFKEYEQITLACEQASLDRLQQLLEEKRRIAITCFEADPWHCHRSRVAKALKARGHFIHPIEHLHPCQHPVNPVVQNARKSL